MFSYAFPQCGRSEHPVVSSHWQSHFVKLKLTKESESCGDAGGSSLKQQVNWAQSVPPLRYATGHSFFTRLGQTAMVGETSET